MQQLSVSHEYKRYKTTRSMLLLEASNFLFAAFNCEAVWYKRSLFSILDFVLQESETKWK